jgi:hypothetical protein
LIVCVRPGVLLVNAKPVCPTKALIRLDFPTLLLPKNAISGRPSEGNWFGLAELVTNSACKLLAFSAKKKLQVADERRSRPDFQSAFLSAFIGDYPFTANC